MGKIKVGIILGETLKKRRGGPSTYLYNLRKGYLNTKIESPYFFAYDMEESGVGQALLKRITGKAIGGKRKIWLVLYELFYIFNWIEKWFVYKKEYSKSKEMDILHFHNALEMYCYNLVFHNKKKQILTMHTPEPFAEEVVHSLQVGLRTEWRFPIVRRFVGYSENWACKRADGFIFPSKETEEIYYKFSYYKTNKKNKVVKYVLTGTESENILASKEEIRNREGLPKDKFIIFFIGRHSQIKGYDLLVQAFDKIKNNGILCVCVGQINPMIPYPKEESFIELGWRKDVMELMKAADLIVLPNRNTYFDLVAIEALSQGKLLLASNTGGTRTLNKGTDGVILFEKEDVDDLADKINIISTMPKDQREKLEKDNYLYYKSHCTLEKFAENYNNAILELSDMK